MFKITIFDRYIFKQILTATVAGLVLFTIIWIMPEIFVKIVHKIYKYHIPMKTALEMLSWEIPFILGKAIPGGILLGTVFVFDRLSKDSELSILRGIGLSFTRIMMPAVVLGFILTFFCFFVGDRLIPAASRAEGEVKMHRTHFVYIQKDENDLPKRGILVSDYVSNQIKNIVIIDFSKRVYDDAVTFENIYFSEWAKVYSDRWTLNNVTQYKISPSGVYHKIEKINQMDILEGEDAKGIYNMILYSTLKDKTFTNAELKNYLELLEKYDFSNEYRATLSKYYQRFFHPLTCILFAILGAMLGFSPPRSQRLIGFTAAVGILFIYILTLPSFDMLAEKGVLPPLLAAAAPVVIFIITAIIIKKKRGL